MFLGWVRSTKLSGLARAFVTSPRGCRLQHFLPLSLKVQAPLGWLAVEKSLKERVPVGTVLGRPVRAGDAPASLPSGSRQGGAGWLPPPASPQASVSHVGSARRNTAACPPCSPSTLNKVGNSFEVIQGNLMLLRAGKQRGGLKITEKL